MKWKEVRELYPNQFVKFEILESHIKDNKEYVDDVIIDTGAFHTIIATDYLEKMDVEFSEDDELVKASGYVETVIKLTRNKGTK